MIAQPNVKPYYTFEEYLAIDEASESRYEYLHGEIFAMAGSSLNHNSISLRLASELLFAIKAKGGKCKTFMSDARLDMGVFQRYYYPDVIVSCSEQDARNGKMVKEPTLIAEILSESTAAKDTREKLIAYLQIPSLEYYLILSQDNIEITLYERTETGWGLRFFTAETDIITLPKMDMQLAVKDLYEGVVWEE